MQTELTLPQEVSIYTVAQLRNEWLGSLNGGPPAGTPDGPYRVDAASVGEIDAAGMQLLLSLGNELARNRRRLELVNPSHTLASAFSALGLASLLDNAAAGKGTP